VSRRRAARKPKSTSERLCALPWVAIAQSVVIFATRLHKLSAKDRARAVRLARSSRGRLSNLSVKERAELGALVVKLDLVGVCRELFMPPRRHTRARRGWRHGRRA
jgi:hypothetical protein